MSKWLKTLVSHTDTLEAAINAISESELFVALVVDDKNRLLGTITDGDVRRALLKHISMDAVVTEFMNSNPVFASTEDSADRLLSIMKGEDILHLPIVDHAGRVVNLETLQNLSQSAKYDNPVFLMAGGFGTRLKHLTKDKPKPLLKVGDTPILELILKQFVDAGFHNFFISTHYKAEMIREHFGSGSNWNVNIQYVHESEPLGTAGALGMLPLKKPAPLY